jgi:hypothetical protein
MNETRVVKLKRSGGKIVQDCDVYIGRRINMGGWNLPQSKWANPFKLKDFEEKYGKEGMKRLQEAYYSYVVSKKELIDSLPELDGKVLGCWCKKKESDPCHGDVLVDLIKLTKFMEDQ